MGTGKIPAGWLQFYNSADRNYGKYKPMRKRMVKGRRR
jgi:hypothetical protein